MSDVDLRCEVLEIQDLVDVGQAFYPGQAFEAGAKAGLASRHLRSMKQHETTLAKRSFQGTSPCIYTILY